MKDTEGRVYAIEDDGLPAPAQRKVMLEVQEEITKATLQNSVASGKAINEAKKSVEANMKELIKTVDRQAAAIDALRRRVTELEDAAKAAAKEAAAKAKAAKTAPRQATAAPVTPVKQTGAAAKNTGATVTKSKRDKTVVFEISSSDNDDSDDIPAVTPARKAKKAAAKPAREAAATPATTQRVTRGRKRAAEDAADATEPTPTKKSRKGLATPKLTSANKETSAAKSATPRSVKKRPEWTDFQ
jgi:hypothetical protein